MEATSWANYALRVREVAGGNGNVWKGLKIAIRYLQFGQRAEEEKKEWGPFSLAKLFYADFLFDEIRADSLPFLKQ